jgi:hypothetical protein
MRTFKEFMEAQDGTQTPAPPSKKELVGYKNKISKGVRDIRDDLSNDYSDPTKFNGDIGPFKLLHSKGKPAVAPIAK